MSDQARDETLFRGLDKKLSDTFKEEYFNEPREFMSIPKVLAIIDTTETMNGQNYKNLLDQQKAVHEVIEQVVMYQHGGLNSTVETMTEHIVNQLTNGAFDCPDVKCGFIGEVGCSHPLYGKINVIHNAFF